MSSEQYEARSSLNIDETRENSSKPVLDDLIAGSHYNISGWSCRCRDPTCQSPRTDSRLASKDGRKFVDKITRRSWVPVRSPIRSGTSRILAPSARSRYEDDRYGAPGMATLNRTVPSSWDPRALGAECRVLAPPPQGDVFSCTKPQWLAQSILTIDHPSSFYRGNNELRTWSRRATLNRGRAFFFLERAFVREIARHLHRANLTLRRPRRLSLPFLSGNNWEIFGQSEFE